MNEKEYLHRKDMLSQNLEINHKFLATKSAVLRTVVGCFVKKFIILYD